MFVKYTWKFVLVTVIATALIAQSQAQAQTQNGTVPPPPGFGSAPTNSGTYIDLGNASGRPMPRPGANTTPPPPSGTRDGFIYAPSKTEEDVTVVYPTDGSDPLYVSKNFADLALKSPGTDQQILNDFRHYEKMTNLVQERFMDHFFPDSSAGDANFQKTAIQGTDRDVIIEQDPMAGPYARVTITDKEGNVLSQASISATAAQQILNQNALSADERIEALAKHDFTLPENARQHFDELTSPQLHAMVIEKPELARQEFTKVAKATAARNAERQTASTGTTELAESTTEPAHSHAPATVTDTEQTTGNVTPKDERIRDVTDEDRSIESDGGSKRSLIIAGLLAIIAGGVFVWALRSRD